MKQRLLSKIPEPLKGFTLVILTFLVIGLGLSIALTIVMPLF
jgi:hypothetical protein